MRKDLVMRWTGKLREQFAQNNRLEAEIKQNLRGGGV